MRFVFHLAQCALNNSDEARLRESTRMAMVCYCLRAQGHDAVIASAPNVLMQSNRWPHFSNAYAPGSAGGIMVYPAESLRRQVDACGVAFKCSVGVKFDDYYLRRCKVLVAHEYDDALANHPKLLKTTFGVHHNVIDHLIANKLYFAFLANDLAPIRALYRDGVVQHEKPIGFYGQKWLHRQAFLESAPDWVDHGLYDHTPAHPAMPTLEHTRWLCGFRACLALRGDSPKTNLPPLLAMLGLPMIFEPIHRNDTPPINDMNAIMFQSWGQVRSAIDDKVLLATVVAQATLDYIHGWSPAGQARLIAERFA